MQHMPDKDFDNLFRDKFMDAEIEPSANLWAKIEDQLEPKRKRIFPIYWMAAASVAIVFTAMLVFQKSEKIQLRPDESTVAATTPTAQSVPTTLEEPLSTSSTQPNVATDRDIESSKVNVSAAKMVQRAILETNLQNNAIAMQPNETTPRLDIKRTDVMPIDVLPIAPVDQPTVIAKVDAQPNMESDQGF
ncbi:MAG: hypothetical protein EOO07_12965 [Chitinophagaceae bacterium]|nr:MAG: hypothetical protein EOO07_12965 [Chitinophagaceae bacterium]